MANEPDADKPVARLAIDTRAYGPLICEHCADSGDEDEGEREEALLMEDGTVVCPKCHTDFKAFEQFSGIITSVSQVKTKPDRRRGGHDIVEDNPVDGCAVHDDDDECSAAPKGSCRYGGCGGEICNEDPIAKTPARYYRDTSSFFCDACRALFIKKMRWDDDEGWVEK